MCDVLHLYIDLSSMDLRQQTNPPKIKFLTVAILLKPRALCDSIVLVIVRGLIRKATNARSKRAVVIHHTLNVIRTRLDMGLMNCFTEL